MSQTYLLLIALLSGMGLGIIIQIVIMTYEVVKNPAKFEKDMGRLVETAREFRIKMGWK